MLIPVGGVMIHIPEPTFKGHRSEPVRHESSTVDYSKLDSNPHEVTPEQVGVASRNMEA